MTQRYIEYLSSLTKNDFEKYIKKDKNSKMYRMRKTYKQQNVFIIHINSCMVRNHIHIYILQFET